MSLPDKYSLPVKYALICAGALLLNLTGQRAFLTALRGPLAIYGALAIGSTLALLFKFAMDKRFIFYHQPDGHRDNAWKFGKYSVLGSITTVMLWTFELAFHYLWGTDIAKYIGGGLGFSLGHYIKYHIDKHLVFV